MHRKWITDLAEQMKHLDGISINVYMDPHTLVRDCEQNVMSEQFRFTNLTALTSLRVFQSGYYVGGGTPWNFSKPRKLILEYSPATRTLEKAADAADVAKHVA